MAAAGAVAELARVSVLVDLRTAHECESVTQRSCFACKAQRLAGVGTLCIVHAAAQKPKSLANGLWQAVMAVLCAMAASFSYTPRTVVQMRAKAALAAP